MCKQYIQFVYSASVLYLSTSPLNPHHAHWLVLLHLAPSHLSVNWSLPFSPQIIEQLELSFPLRWVPPPPPSSSVSTPSSSPPPHPFYQSGTHTIYTFVKDGISYIFSGCLQCFIDRIWYYRDIVSAKGKVQASLAWIYLGNQEVLSICCSNTEHPCSLCCYCKLAKFLTAKMASQIKS